MRILWSSVLGLVLSQIIRGWMHAHIIPLPIDSKVLMRGWFVFTQKCRQIWFTLKAGIVAITCLTV